MAEGRWIADHVNLIITGLTGSGKTWLSHAFGHCAARDDDSVLCARTPRLLEDVAVARAGGRYLGPLGSLAKVRLLMLDDWAIKPMAGDQRHDLLKVAQDRCGRASTLIASQIPVAEWHAAIGEAALVDATRAGQVDEAIKAAAWVAGGCLAVAPGTTPPTHRGERNWARFRQSRKNDADGSVNIETDLRGWLGGSEW